MKTQTWLGAMVFLIGIMLLFVAISTGDNELKRCWGKMAIFFISFSVLLGGVSFFLPII
jgi:glucan phosphoethanolaminetransferase (alkaline phosphatase superfamily)